MENKNQQNIDKWLKNNFDNHTPTEGGNFSDFLTKLDNFNNNQVSVDQVIHEKLSNSKQYSNYNWKNIIYLIWFRRIKNSLYVIVPAILIFLGFKYYFNSEMENLSKKSVKTVVNELDLNSVETNLNSNIDIKIGEDMESENRFIKSENKVFDGVYKSKVSSLHVNNLISVYLNNNTINDNLNEVIDFDFNSISMVKMKTKSQEEIVKTKIKFKDHLTKEKHWLFDFNHKQVMLNLYFTNGFHNFSTSVDYKPKQINKYYETLVNDGRQTGNSFNFGFQVDKLILRNVSISLGFQTNNMNHLQHSKFVITEVPVIDIDGKIKPDYIKINPEKIELVNNFKINAIAIPLKLQYHLTLNKNYFASLYLGGSFTRFKLKNYGNIDQKELYNLNKERELKFSNFKNIEYGFDINKSLKNNFLISLGLSSQQFFDLKTSNNLYESTKANNYQIKFTLKYNLLYGKN